MEAVDDTSEHFRAIVTDIDGTNGLQPSLKIFVRILIDPERHACETHVKRIPSLATTSVALALSALTLFTSAGSSASMAQSSSSSPEASDASPSPVPQGALGLQIAWLLNTLNTPANDTTGDPIEKHVSPELLARISADKLAADLLELNANLDPFTIEDGQIITTMDFPPTVSDFVLVSPDGSTLKSVVVVDRDSRSISSFMLGDLVPTVPAGTPVA